MVARQGCEGRSGYFGAVGWDDEFNVWPSRTVFVNLGEAFTGHFVLLHCGRHGVGRHAVDVGVQLNACATSSKAGFWASCIGPQPARKAAIVVRHQLSNLRAVRFRGGVSFLRIGERIGKTPKRSIDP